MSVKLRDGDVVVLKSGGPKMTVMFDSDTNTIMCCWFLEGKRIEGIFSIGSLKGITVS